MILVPASVEHLSEMADFKLPLGIITKPTGCGATTAAIIDQTVSTVIYMPRVPLIKNKHMSHPETQMVFRDITDQEIKDYIAEHEVKKFLCTYDSAKRLKRLIGNEWRDYHHVIDEYHMVLLDASFKADTEYKFIQTVKDAPMQSWISATPIMSYFTEQMPHLSSLPVTEFVPENKRVCHI